MTNFKLKSNYKVTGDQQNAIDQLAYGIENGINYQVLLGVTGSGKTFTIANLIAKLGKPALIISHNKTLAAQLYQEFRDFFPENAVSYFVSYYDYYQPEAYIPSTDTYIEKDADINELIDKLRLQATTNLLTRKDAIVVASVSCIYNIGSPKEYGNFILEIKINQKITRDEILNRLIDLQYERSDFGFFRGTFRVTGDIIDIYPAYLDEGVRIDLVDDTVRNISYINPVSGSLISVRQFSKEFILFPAKHYVTDPLAHSEAFDQINHDLTNRLNWFKKHNKFVEANRLKQRVNYDIEMIKEVGYVKGIENYSRYFDGRREGDPPYSLLDYFNHPFAKDWLVFIDESHITFPQIRGMYAGDLSRKKLLVDYGFRLPAAFDNRPLRFEEFIRRIPNFIATSATPSDWEKDMARQSSNGKHLTKNYPSDALIEQLTRPTGIPDPDIEIRPVKNEVQNVIEEIHRITDKHQRVLVTTLTKRTAEDLAQYLSEEGIKVHYLHSDIATLERTDILDDLRRGEYDALIGVNLLREGLDLPEVSLVAILDADKEGFLRSDVSLIQTMGRAARHVDGKVILYADKITGSMQRAIEEVERRRAYQIKMNKLMDIKPRSIEKPIREKLIEKDEENEIEKLKYKGYSELLEINSDALTPLDRKKLVIRLRQEMKLAAQDLNFELAAALRDKIHNLLT